MADQPKKPARAQHVVAHIDDNVGTIANPVYDEVLVFGQEIDALRHTHGKPGWVYAPVAHGQSFTEALAAKESRA